MAERTELTFDSGGADCAAYLYRPAPAEGSPGDGPAASSPAPCLVMGHGFSGTRDDRLPDYARRFAAAGLAVLVFDYRHFGASGGQPRQLVDIGRQQEDYHAAIRCARGLEGVDPDRIVLWGSSFSGGHVIAVAARDFQIAAVIAQVPYADGLSVAWQVPIGIQLGLLAAALRDVSRAVLNRPPQLVPVVGPAGTTVVMPHPEAEPGVRAQVGAGSRWRNAVTARTLLSLPLYRPGRRSEHLGMPLLICVSEADGITPPGPAIRMAQRAPRAELRRYPGGHFALYAGETFERAVEDQIEFLRRHRLAGG